MYIFWEVEGLMAWCVGRVGNVVLAWMTGLSYFRSLVAVWARRGRGVEC